MRYLEGSPFEDEEFEPNDAARSSELAIANAIKSAIQSKRPLNSEKDESHEKESS